ncbi:type I restriction enzyme, S subunit [Parageobacillus thermantarcticus]|jgi:type I restriction enzyme, S subunit|uniref:Type I restriction enzyme, S subunit n=1 Tax=Parageobacillus thermantarcticus TaxID=186116 RepID=A0A1I0TU81_9BACL|nr:restriction endonuclease subunit S [Parageobacillus thermantarcticus]SFA55369.1 type I restriction enzyme, S subunit [Parageobacillus thermantarcticus]
MKYMKVKDLFKIIKGKKVEQVYETNENTVRLIQIDDLRNDDNIKYCERKEEYIFANKNDVIIAWDGANAGTIGYGLEGAIGSTLAILRTDSNNSNNIFIPYIGRFLQSKSKYLRDTCTGATIPHISKKALEEIKIPIPSYEKQIEISKILDKAQELIDKRKAQIESLEQLVQSLFWEMFGTYLTSNRNKMFFGELVKEFRYGTSVKSGEFGYPILRIPNIVNGIIDESDLKYCELPEKDFLKLKLQENDLLFVRTNGNPNYVGRCASVTKKQEGYVYASYLIRARIDLDKLNTEYVTKYMNSVFGRHEIIQKATTSAGQYNINTEGLGNILIPVPPLNLQEDFARKIKLIDAKKAILQRGLLELENMFNSLMQRAFKGELFND